MPHISPQSASSPSIINSIMNHLTPPGGVPHHRDPKFSIVLQLETPLGYDWMCVYSFSPDQNRDVNANVEIMRPGVSDSRPIRIAQASPIFSLIFPPTTTGAPLSTLLISPSLASLCCLSPVLLDNMHSRTRHGESLRQRCGRRRQKPGVTNRVRPLT